MAQRLQDRVAVVTGSTAGIGRATAELFAREGARVIVSGRRRELGEQVAEGICVDGGQARFFQADVTQGEELRALMAFAVASFGRLDILVNNAWSGWSDAILDLAEERWDYIFDVTVRACFLGTKYALPEMIRQGKGNIINLSSVHGLLAAHAFAPYDAAKAAIINLTRQTAVDYGPQGIRANAICPGMILTDAVTEFVKTHPEYEQQARLVYPLQRAGRPEEVAEAALFLASDASSFITGHALVVDGGMTIQLQDSLVEACARAWRAEQEG